MLTRQAVQKRRRQVRVLATQLLGGGLFLLLLTTGAAGHLASQGDRPAYARAIGAEVAPAPPDYRRRTPTPTPTPAATLPPTGTPTPVPTPCAPGNANYAIKQATGRPLVAGSLDIGLHCSECSTTIGLPFPYTLYDRTFTTAIVTSKGTLGFIDVTQAYWSDCLPDEYSNYAIFPHWDDLDLSATCGTGDCGAYTSVSGQAPHRIFNIEWRARYHNLWNTLNFEVRLYEGQTRFDLVYGYVTLEGYNATVGVQRDTGSLYTEFSCWGYVLPEGLELEFTLPACRAGPTPTPVPVSESN